MYCYTYCSNISFKTICPKKLKLLFSGFPTPSLPFPIIGHSHLFFNVNREDILDTLLALLKGDIKQRKMMTIIGNKPLLWIFHPEPTEEVLSSNEIISKSEEYTYLQVNFLPVSHKQALIKIQFSSHGWELVY